MKRTDDFAITATGDKEGEKLPSYSQRREPIANELRKTTSGGNKR